jgi:PAS domain S-box-containing protein
MDTDQNRGRSADAAERVRAYEALRHSPEWLEAVLQASRDGIVVEDDHLLVYVNGAAARLHGYDDPREMIGRPTADFQTPEDGPRMREYGRRRLCGEAAPPVYAFRARHRDGSAVDLEASVSVCRAGGKDYILTVLRDLSERRSLEEQLRQAQKMEAVGRLAGGVAHDFNNLLTVITGYSDLLLASPRTDEVGRRLIGEVRRAGERAAALTAQLLAFSRKQVVQPRVLDLSAAVADAQNMVRRLIGEDVELVATLDPAAGRVRADPGQVDQVLLNLAVNARDAMPAGGTLAIRTRGVERGETYPAGHPEAVSGRYALLEVADTGCGMTAQVRARLFEPFFTTKEPGKGTGLGLATVYGIVKQSGGHIEVDSTPGRGTTFRIYLPRVDGPEPGPGGSPAVQAPRGNETVLLVEDEEEVRVLARLVLRAGGYQVLEARDGEEALAVCQAHAGAVDLVVTDVIMPRLGGPELAARLRTLRPGARVLYMSGYTDDALGRQQLLGPDAPFLQKPFTVASLAAKVRAVLDRPVPAGGERGVSPP